MKYIHHETIDSTNSAAWRLIDRGEFDSTIITAKTQTSGRGQWGRTWHSLRGGLYLSYIYYPSQPIEDGSIITIWTVWGIVKILRDYVPGLSIKAPNDLMIDRYKLGGILTETRWQENNLLVAVIGVGINGWNQAPEMGIAISDLNTSIDCLDTLQQKVITGINLGKNRFELEGISNIYTEYQDLLRP